MRRFVYDGRDLFVRAMGSAQRLEFRYDGDGVWFTATRNMWEGFSPDALRLIAEVKARAALADEVGR